MLPRPLLARSTSVLFAVALLVFAGSAHAKTDPVVACAAFKLKTVGTTTSALLGCQAKAAPKGVAVDPECLAVPPDKLAAAFAKAEAAVRKAGKACQFENDAADSQGEIDALVSTVVAALRPQAGASKCAAKKLGSVGKHTQKLLAAYAKNLLKTDTFKLNEAVAKSKIALAATFGKLDDKGKDCQTSGDEPAMIAESDELIGAEVCDDGNRCTIDTVGAGAACLSAPVTCPTYRACDFRTGSCEVSNCCLMSLGAASCVVTIPDAEVPTSQAFCQSVDTLHDEITLLSVGAQCIGLRAAGSDDCF